MAWLRNTDLLGRVHVKLRRTGNKRFIDLFKDEDRTQLVGQGSIRSNKGLVNISERNGSGLNGQFELNYSQSTSNIYIAAIPEYLALRLLSSKRYGDDKIGHLNLTMKLNGRLLIQIC